MSIKTNTASLQSLLEQVNTLPEAGGTVQKVVSTFTLGDNILDGVSVDCGFKPDIVIIPIVDQDSQMYTVCFPFFEEQERIFGYTVDRNKGRPTNSEFLAQIYNYIAIKYT